MDKSRLIIGPVLCGLILVVIGPYQAYGKQKLSKRTSTPTATPRATATMTPAPDQTGEVKRPDLYALDTGWSLDGTNAIGLNDPKDIFVTHEGDVYVADSGNNRVLVFNKEGKILKSIGSFGMAAMWRNDPFFNNPSGVFVATNKMIYVADTNNHRIVILDQNGLVVSFWGSQGNKNGNFNSPLAVAKSRFGEIWVLDSGNSRIQIFGALGEFKESWGVFGSEPGKLNFPSDMALNIIDQAYVLDAKNFRFQVFNDKGAPVTARGWFGGGPGQFKEPSGIEITRTGLVAVADGADGRVQFFNQRAEYLGEWRAKKEDAGQNRPQHFVGISSDHDGRLYLTDINNDAVIRLKPLSAQGSDIHQPVPTISNSVEFYGGQGYPSR